MQLRKLRYFSSLIHVQWKHYCQPSRCHHYRYQGLQNRKHYPCKWNILMLSTVLIALMTVVMATISTHPIANISVAENLDNVVALVESTMDNDNRNFTDDFEHVLREQLQREEGLKVSSSWDSNQNLKFQETDGYQRKTLLSRKRRYLLFPEGTSFQLVYDGIVGIVDYTNYLILGITLALAWELPTKAPSEMLEDIKMQIDDGTLLLPRNDSATNINYVDTRKKSQKLKLKSYSKPNYIKFQNLKSTHAQQPYYYSHRTNNKRPMIQPVFRPPMHGSYYFNNRNQSPYYNYYHAKPGSSSKYAYYFQPKIKNIDARLGLTPHNYGKENYGDWRRKDNFYYKNVSQKPKHPFTKWLPSKSLYTNTKYPWWNLNSRLQSALRGSNKTGMTATGRQFNNVNNNVRQQERIQQQTSRSGYYQSRGPTTTKITTKIASTQRKHRIYPVFGKRSLKELHSVTPQKEPHLHRQQRDPQQQRNHRNEQQHQRHRCGIDNVQLSKFDRIHIRHHRRTRHTLYEKIEKYLDKRGSHGHHCVLRALCETGQKATDVEPGTFLGELMRTLFTIPEPIEEDSHRLEYKEKRFDAAHAYTGNCAARYFHCKDSLWESHFVA